MKIFGLADMPPPPGSTVEKVSESTKSTTPIWAMPKGKGVFLGFLPEVVKSSRTCEGQKEMRSLRIGRVSGLLNMMIRL